MTRATVLVVDDDPSVVRVLRGNLEEEGYQVLTAPSGEAALALLDQRAVDAVVTDLRMPGMSGTSLVAEVKRRFEDLPIVVVTAYPSVESAVEAIRLGAYDYIQKPFQRDDLLHSLEKALVASRRAGEAIADSQTGIVRQSHAMAEVSSLVARVARTDATVLVTGETGAGKEVVARAIHDGSPRAKGPFLKVHCAALPEPLLESELFGYERGAFTGAASRKPGRLELAGGGTLFLDEIGDVSASTQVKLLRILQDRAYERLGGTETLLADVRIVAATHRDLEAMVAAGRFRQDLFYRLHVFPIRVPPLRERMEDVGPLARTLLARAARHAQGPIELEESAIHALEEYDWPGNVRELSNLLERLAILAQKRTIDRGDVLAVLPPRRSRPPEESGLASARAATEKGAIERALGQAGGNRTRAAKLLGISRRTLYTKLEELGIG